MYLLRFIRLLRSIRRSGRIRSKAPAPAAIKLQSVPVFALIGQLACERDDCRQFQ